MKHHLDKSRAGPLAAEIDEAITACVHCGFCLPSCPTYQELGEEMDSPRGRIYLMKEVLEGKLDPDDARLHIDRCLGCLACETSCPSGVPYHKLISPYRAAPGGKTQRSLIDRLKRLMVMQTLPFPSRFRLAVRFRAITKAFQPLLPRALGPMIDLMPKQLPPADPLPEKFEPRGTRRARIALLAGCVQQALDPDINRATIDVLVRNGVEVLVPPHQSCCGSLAWHLGELPAARAYARTTLDAFPTDIDAVIVNAAGCGSGMSEYPLMFETPEEKERAAKFSALVTDVSVFLDQLGIDPPPPLKKPLRVAYHDACHHCHARQIRQQPRRILESIEGLELVELGDGERCCGSAGTYNIDQPELASELGRKKAKVILGTECDLAATGNIGCMIQIRTHLANSPSRPPPVLHTAQILARAYSEEL